MLVAEQLAEDDSGIDATRTLCVGVDITWYGRSPRRRSSQIEAIVSAVVGEPEGLSIETVDLHDARNPNGANPTEPTFDADGGVLYAAVSRVLD